MEISAEKAKLMTNNANGIHRETKVKGHSSTMEQLFQMMAPYQGFSQGLPKPLQLLQRQSPFGEITKYLSDQRACESWTLTAELETRMQAFEMRC